MTFERSCRKLLNSHIVGVGYHPTVFDDLSKFITENPTAKYITVPSASSRTGAGKSSPSLLAGELAKRAVDEDAYIIFDPATPKKVLDAVERKFNYIVIRGRDPLEKGGILRGYQIPHRLFIGDLDAAKKAAEENRALYEAKQKEKEAQERRRKMEEIVSASKPIALLDPIFTQGRYVFGFQYKTSDNVRHEDTCRADERDEVYQKLRTVKIRPSRVWCNDPAYEADHAKAISSTVPSSSSTTGADIATRLKQLDALKEQGLISESEYTDKRGKILAEL